MIATYRKWFAFWQLVLALLISAIFINTEIIDSPELALLLGFSVIFLLRAMFIGQIFLLPQYRLCASPEGHRIGCAAACRLLIMEIYASTVCTLWSMLFCTFKRRISNDATGLPVLLLHGFGCNSGYWHFASKCLTNEGITHYAVDLEPVFASIDEYVLAVHSAIETMCGELGRDRVILVAHSMGGLVARAYMRDHGIGRVAKLITLGTPHHGTAFTNLGLEGNLKQMSRSGPGACDQQSAWLQQLEDREQPGARSLVVSIYSHQDNAISPQVSSELKGARNIAVHGMGHVTLGFNDSVLKVVCTEIKACSSEGKK